MKLMLSPKLLLLIPIFASQIEAKAWEACQDENYEQAYQEMADMLEGKVPLSVRRSVFMAEWAFLDGNLDYEKDFWKIWGRF